MEPKHLSYFKVENFKRFDSLEVNDIGQFNLIVGDNNVGKTTLLEALLFDEDYTTLLINLGFALYTKSMIRRQEKNYNYLDFFVQNNLIPIKFTYNYNNSLPQSFSFIKKLFADIEPEDLHELQKYLVIGPNVTYDGFNFAIEFDYGKRKEYGFTSYLSYIFDDKNVPYLSFNLTYEEWNEIFFSRLSISTQNLDNFVKDLKEFIPNLSSIELNQALIPQKTIIAIREHGKNLIPLAQYGDGTVKLFRYLLKLESLQGSRLMIDEIDAGIHYSRLKDFLKKVIQTAKNKNVQIFATTHSKECLGYFTEALQELNLEDEGRIIRLADTKSGIKAYSMRFDEFDNALYGNNEIR